MTIGQELFVRFIESVWDFGKEERERHRVAKMSPQELRSWRAEQCLEIQKRANKLTSLNSNGDLRKRGMTCEQFRRGYEIMMLNDLGVKHSLHLLEGEDIRGLDLTGVKGLSQDQINYARGDSKTRLPKYLLTPPAWFLEGMSVDSGEASYDRSNTAPIKKIK